MTTTSTERKEWAGVDLNDPRAILSRAVELYHPRLALASSFSAEDVMLIDLLVSITKEARVFALDTGRLNPETYDCAEAIRERYGIEIEWYFPKRDDVEELVRTKGMFSFRESVLNRKECCYIRKVEPLGRALKDLDAWITGLRREQSTTRTELEVVEVDEVHGGIIKINPLSSLSDGDVWEYVREHEVPYNKLHDLGYPSIGCAPCTRAIQPGEDIRAGRWWWENPENKECGLHINVESTKGAGI